MAKKKTTKKTTKKRTAKKTPGKKVSKKTAGKRPSKKKTARIGSGADSDRQTMEALVRLADNVSKAGLAGGDPALDVPSRTLSNTNYNTRRKMLEMGDAYQQRELFNLNQAKKFMQTLLVGKGVKALIEQGKTSSLRGMFYQGLHTIAGTKEKTFGDQSECDSVLEDLEVILGSMREQLHVFAEVRGGMVGNITLTDAGDTIDCRRMGSGGYQIPSIVEPDVIEFGKCEAEFILHVEKGTVWRRFNEDRFWEKHNCILTHGGGQPPRGVRRLLRRMHEELGLPVYCVLDCDPWGHYIYSVIKQGSISLAFESERMAIPDAKFLGIRAMDYDRYDLSDDVQIALNDRDTTRARQIAEYPWFAGKKPWQMEIQKMLKNGFKMEVEALITKDISYVTEVYVPDRLAAKDWLD